LRKYIYINDSASPLVSLDFSAMHPRLAYNLENEACDNDPYIIEGYGED